MKKTYRTEQKEALLNFLKENQDKELTIKEMTCALKSNSIGKSTIYRLINNLCNDGLVLRIIKDNSPTGAYQFLGECSCHIHLKCISCGTLIHLDDSISNHLDVDLKKNCNFEIDKHQTMIVGRCKDCTTYKEIQ